MTTLSLSSLPPELLHHVLSYLPTSDLFTFARTSKCNYDAGVTAFRSLNIGAFPPSPLATAHLARVLGIPSDEQPMVRVQMDSKRSRSARVAVRDQNVKLARIIRRHGHGLRDLDISVWGLEDSLATSLARLRRLRRLSIRMDHPYERMPGHRYSCKCTQPPGTVWNQLYDNTGSASPPLGRLKALRLDSASITDYQLRRILESNPDITELRLSKCSHITEEFWHWLAHSRFAERLKVLHFTDSPVEEADNRLLDYLDSFTNLESLSLLGCHRIDNEEVQRRNKDIWGIAELTAPSCTTSPVLEPTDADSVEVDPLYKFDDLM